MVQLSLNLPVASVLFALVACRAVPPEAPGGTEPQPPVIEAGIEIERAVPAPDPLEEAARWVVESRPEGTHAFRLPLRLGRDETGEEIEVASEPIRLRGSFVVTSADGSVSESADGSFELHSSWGTAWMHRSVDVRDGSWDVSIEDVPRTVEVRIDDATVNGRRARVVSPSGALTVSEERQVRVDVRIPPATVLRVIDAANGAELSGIDVLDAASHPGVHPGSNDSSKILGHMLRSPVDLGSAMSNQEKLGARHLFVGAPGYAWETVWVDTSLGGERVVALSPGADLAVEVRGVAPSALTSRCSARTTSIPTCGSR